MLSVEVWMLMVIVVLLPSFLISMFEPKLKGSIHHVLYYNHFHYQ
jgi:hypothetical protein